VGLDTKTAMATLGSYGIPDSALNVTDVSSDPTWTDAVVAAGASYSPAAYRLGITPRDPLTMYVKGDAVVGFVITSPTAVLQAQVAALQNTVNILQTQLNGPQSTTVETGPSTEAAQRKSKPKPAQEQA
jgi:hypothetical protein